MTQPSSTKAQLAQNSSKLLTEFTRVRDLMKRKKNLVQPYNSNSVQHPNQDEEPEDVSSNPYGIQTVVVPEFDTEKSIKKKYQEYASQNIRRNFFTSQRGRLAETRLERSQDVMQARFNSSIEQLESQWNTMKQEHNFDVRASNLEANNPDEENIRGARKLELKSFQERRQASCEQRRLSKERSLRVNDSFGSRRVPHARVNLTDYATEPFKRSGIVLTSEPVLETSSDKSDKEENILLDKDIVHIKTQPSHETPVRQTRLKWKKQRTHLLHKRNSPIIDSPLRSNSVDKTPAFESIRLSQKDELFSEKALVDKNLNAMGIPSKNSSEPQIIPIFLSNYSSPNPKNLNSKLLKTPIKQSKISVKVADDEEYNYLQPKFEIIRDLSPKANVQKKKEKQQKTKTSKKTTTGIKKVVASDKKIKVDLVKTKSNPTGENAPFFNDKKFTDIENNARQRISLALNPQFKQVETAKKDHFSTPQLLRFNSSDLQTPTKVKIPRASQQYLDGPTPEKTVQGKGSSTTLKKKEDYSDDIEEYASEASPVKGNEFVNRMPPVFETKAIDFSSPNKNTSFEESLPDEPEKAEKASISLIKKVQEKLLENNIQVSYPKYQSKKEEMMFSPPQTKLRKNLSHTMNEASFDKMKKSKTSSGIKTTLQKSSTNNSSLLNVVISPKIPNKILSPSHEMIKEPPHGGNHSSSFQGSNQGQYWDKLKKKYVINLKLHV